MAVGRRVHRWSRMSLWQLLVVASLMLLLSACDQTIHFYPEPEEPAELQDVVLYYHIDNNAPIYHKEVVYNQDWERHENELKPDPAPLPEVGDDYEMRVIIEIYDAQDTKFSVVRDEVSRGPEPCRRHVLYVEHNISDIWGEIHEQLPKGEYYALAWADYVPRDIRHTWHFYPDLLTNVTTDLDTYPDNTHLRSVAAGRLDFDTSQSEVTVHLTRASGRLRILATDLFSFYTKRSYQSLKDVKVQVTYTRFIGVAYNVDQQEPCDFTASYSFTSRGSDEEISMSEGTASLAVDYIFAGTGRENHVMADIKVLDADDNVINTVQGIDIPLWRNRETVVKGNFLTKPHGEGMVIDETFDNEVVIHF